MAGGQFGERARVQLNASTQQAAAQLSATVFGHPHEVTVRAAYSRAPPMLGTCQHGRPGLPCSPMRPAQRAGGQPSAALIRGYLYRHLLILAGEQRIKLKLSVDDHVGAVDFEYGLRLTANRQTVFEHTRRPAALVFLAARSVRGLDLIFRYFSREFLPSAARRFVGQIVKAGRLRLEVADQSFTGP